MEKIRTIRDELEKIAQSLYDNEGQVEKDLKESIKYLRKTLKITELQAEILSFTVFAGDIFDIDEVNYSKLLKNINIQGLKYNTKKYITRESYFRDSYTQLLERDFLRYDNNIGSFSKIVISEKFKLMIQTNEVPEEVEKTVSGTLELISVYSEYIDSLLKPDRYNLSLADKYRYMTPKLCIELIENLFQKNKKLSFVKNFFGQFNLDCFLVSDKISLLYMISERIKGHKKFEWEDLSEIYPRNKRSIISLQYSLGKSILFNKGYLEDAGENFMGGGFFQLTKKTLNTFLNDVDYKNSDITDKKLLTPNDIVEKDLFYEDKFRDKIDELYSYLEPKKYQEIIKRLEEKGFKPGFTCLFYGGPGTGKTESVLQLAKNTGRNIYKVDLSEIRDKYVGESEKKLKEIFDDYNEELGDPNSIPILLFNEADGIIGSRLETQRDSVDKMENTLQNILLQELEDFKGILIATTNLHRSLDKAFERRFLYKLNFPMPNPEVRAKIWISKIEDLDGDDAIKLAKNFNLSGGQIDNVAKKYLIQEILKGKPKEKFELLERYCKEELLEKQTPIGYGSSN